MDNFMPTNLQGWVTLVSSLVGILGSLFGGFGYLLNKYVTQPLKEMRADMKEINAAHGKTLQDHEIRLVKVEGKVFTSE